MLLVQIRPVASAFPKKGCSKKQAASVAQLVERWTVSAATAAAIHRSQVRILSGALMAEEKNQKKELDPKDEKMLGEVADELNRILLDRMKGRPYLLVLTTGFEAEKKGEETVFAAQWAWRTNVYIKGESGEKLMDFLASQLRQVVDDPQDGIGRFYFQKKKP